MSKRKTIKKFNLPPSDQNICKNKPELPFNGSLVTKQHFSFSFACFDRRHELFNLGDNTKEGVVSARWFIDLIDCLKSVSNMSINTLKKSMHDLHPVDWSKANASIPSTEIQCEYWQFRISKTKGRVIGFLIDEVFYVVWLDPHHNLTDSDGYESARQYKPALSLYEMQELEIAQLKSEIKNLNQSLQAAEELLDSCENKRGDFDVKYPNSGTQAEG